jgi:hypothetical protein
MILSLQEECNIWGDNNKYYLSPSLRHHKEPWDREFEQFLTKFSSDDSFFRSRINKKFWVKVSTYDGDELIDKNSLESLPASYTYDGRIYPSASQQEKYNLKLYLTPILKKGLRTVCNDDIGQNESIRYWFLRNNEDWMLTFISIKRNKVHNPEVEKSLQ